VRVVSPAEIARYEKGCSRRQAADAVGVSERTIGRIESGEVKPSAETAKALADFYGVTVARLLGVDQAAA